MKKFALSLLLVLIVAALGVATVFAFDYPSFEVNAETETFVIETEEDFLSLYAKGVADKDNGTTNLNVNVELATDIYLSRYYAGGSTTLNTSSLSIAGTFNGRGHAIVGLKNTLFASITATGSVKNLRLVGVDFSSSVTATPLTLSNAGTIDGVEVSGSIEATNIIAGLVGTNSGNILNSKVVLSINTPATNLFPIASNVEGGKVNNSYAYFKQGETYLEPTTAHSLDEEDVLSEANPLADGIDGYLECYLSLLKGDGALLNSPLNLYGVPFKGIDNVNLTSVQNGYPVYNASFATLSNVSYTMGATALPSMSIELVGGGTKENPYEISSIADLTYFGTLTDAKYAILTTSIDVSEYITSAPVISALNGTLDLNGNAIVGVNGNALIGTVSASGILKNGFISGSGVEHVIGENLGIISSVTFSGSDISYAVGVNSGTLYHLSVNLLNGGVAEENANGFILNTRNLGGGKFIFTENSVDNGSEINGIVGAYQVGDANSLSDFNALLSSVEGKDYVFIGGSVFFQSSNGTYTYSGDVDASTLIPTENLYKVSDNLYSSWHFGFESISLPLNSETPVLRANSYGYSFKSGVLSDNPILVFPEDNLSYKYVTKFDSVTNENFDKYGEKQVSGEQDFNIAEGTLNQKSEIENYILGNALSSEIENYIVSNGLTFAWYARSVGSTSFSDYVKDTATAINADDGKEYRFYIINTYVYVDATVKKVNDGTADVFRVSYQVTEWGTGMVSTCFKLNTQTQNIQTLLNDMGFVSSESTNPFDFEDSRISYKIEKIVGGEAVSTIFNGDDTSTHANFLVEAGDYRLTFFVPQTETQTAAEIIVNFTRTLGDFQHIDNYVLQSTKGGLERNTLTYNGSEITFSDTDLYFEGLLLSTRITVQEITSYGYETEGGNIIYPTLPQNIQNAGIYTLNLKVYIEGYNDISLTATLYVERLNVTVRPYVVKGENLVKETEITYYDAHPEIAFRDKEGAVVDFLEGLSYESEYSVGKEANQVYYVTLKASTLNANVNYKINADDTHVVAITVKPYTLNVLNALAQSKTVTYNGLEHSLEELPVVSPTDVELSYIYKINDRENLTSISGIKNVGVYNITATVTTSNTNYVIGGSGKIERTITVNPHKITVKAEDVSVSFNGEPSFSIAVTPSIENETVSGENYLEVLENLYTVSAPDYVKGVSDSTAPPIAIIVTLKEGEYTEVEGGKLVGNYLVTDLQNGTLTVLKKAYVLDMVTEYEYSQNGITLDFKDETLPEEATLTYYRLSGGVETALPAGTVPHNACDSTFLYVVYISIPASNSYVGVENLRKEFAITKHKDEISGIYVWNKGFKVGLLEEVGSVIYNGTDFTIDVDRDELLLSEYTITYTYKLNGVAKTGTISQKDVGSISEVKIMLDGGQNCLSQEISSVYSLTVNPKELRFNESGFKPDGVYNGSVYDSLYFENRVKKEFTYLLEYAPIGEDDPKIACSELNGYEPRLPNTYNIKITAKNPNYFFNKQGELDYNVTFTIGNFQANINLAEDIGNLEFEYTELKRNGNVTPTVEVKNYTLMISDKPYIIDVLELEIAYEGSEEVLLPGTYGITGIKPKTAGTDVLIEFNCIGEGKVTIKPMEIYFSYASINLIDGAPTGIKAEYTFDTKEIVYPTSFARAMVYPVNEDKISSVGNDCFVSLKMQGEERAFKHAGIYEFVPEILPYEREDGSKVYCYKIREDLLSFTSVINKFDVVYEIAEKEIFVLENLPTVNDYVITYDLIKKPFINSSPSVSVVGLTSIPTEKGEYSVMLNVRYLDGGKFYDDYNCIKKYPDSKELKVKLYEFDASLTVQNVVGSTYNFNEQLPLVVGLPSGAEVEYSCRPVNSGNYDVTVTVTKQYYEPKEFTATVEILKVQNYIVLPSIPKQVKYHKDYVLSVSDINATAMHLGFRVEGTFAFEGTPTLKYGLNNFTISFTPTPEYTQNFNLVSGLNYSIESIVDATEIDLFASYRENGFGGTGEESDNLTPENPFNGYEISGVGQATLIVSLPESLIGKAELVIDGVPCIGYSYTFTRTRDEGNKVLVSIMLEGKEIYSCATKVIIYTPDLPVEPDTPSEPTTPPQDEPSEPTTPEVPSDNSDGENLDGGKGNLGLIIGLSVGGGVVVIGVAVVIIIIVKKKNGGAQ